MTQLRSLLGSAYETARRGYYSDARDEFDFILKHDPRSVEALYGMAACSYRLKEFGRSIDELERLLRIDPKHSEARALRDTVKRDELAEATSGHKTDVFHFPTLPREAFGEGDSKAVIPEWLPVGPKDVTLRELQDAEGTRLFGKLSIRKTFRTARKVYRRWRGSLYLASVLALVVQAGVLSFLLRFLVPYLLLAKSEFNVLLAALSTLVLLLILPINSFHAFQVLVEGTAQTSKRQSMILLERWPKMASAFFYANIPFLLMLIFWRGPRDVLAPLDSWGFREVLFLFLGIVQIYFWIRCWFIAQISGLEGTGGLQAFLRAWYGTRGNVLRTTLFACLQVLLLPLALLPFAYGYPLLSLRQAEAYRSIYRQEEPERAMQLVLEEEELESSGDTSD